MTAAMATSLWTELTQRLRNLARLTTIEPIVFFNFLALPFFHVSQHAILYKSVCLQNYAASAPGDTYACDNLKHHPNLEDHVQKDASAWNMYLSLSYLVPAIASDIFLGAWSDRNGRKVSILIGFAGLVATSVAYIALALYPRMPLYILVLANIMAGVTGYIAIVLISSMAYLTDVVTNKSTLTFRMIVVLSFRWISDVIGSFTTSVLLKMSNPAVTMLFAQSFFALGFFYTLARLHQMPPEQLRKLTVLEKEKRKEKMAEDGKSEKPPQDEKPANGLSVVTRVPLKQPEVPGIEKQTKSGCCDEFVQTCRFVIQLYKDVWRTLERPRKRHKRLHIFICTMVYFCFMVSEVGLQSGPIMSLYVFHRPFYWSPSNLGTFRGVQSACSFVGSIVGALINRHLHLEDTTIMLISIASGIAHLTLIGVSQRGWMLYTAIVIGALYSLLVPSVKAFLVRLVEPDEVGKTLAANGIAADLAFVCSTLVFTNIYSATVTAYPGSVFLIAAATLACCFGAVLWMRIDQNRQQRRVEASFSSDKTSWSIGKPIIGVASYSLTSMPLAPTVTEVNKVSPVDLSAIGEDAEIMRL